MDSAYLVFLLSKQSASCSEVYDEEDMSSLFHLPLSAQAFSEFQQVTLAM